VKPNGKMNNKAIRFLEDMTKGQKVFLRFDEIKHDEGNGLFCYLYLKNKTFVNAHLIKSGLVSLDKSSDYRMRRKFTALTNQLAKTK
jgi:site-specific DNA-methyltransferase (adenine-specific)